MMHRAICAVLLLIALLLLPGAFAKGKTLRVLFVGNSLTYYNDLPETFATLYRATEPGTSVQTEMLAAGGSTLREHVREGQLATLLTQQHYDIVVLQEMGGWPLCATGDARCEDSPLALRDAVNLVRANGAQALWYSTWQAIPAAQQHLSASANEIAADIGVEMIDVGFGMQQVEPSVRRQLLIRDDGHPDVAGTWLAAAMLVKSTSTQTLPKETPLRSCGTNWRGGNLNATAPASTQARGRPQCHAITAPQWRALRAVAMR